MDRLERSRGDRHLGRAEERAGLAFDAHLTVAANAAAVQQDEQENDELV